MRLHENKEFFADAIEAASRPQNEGGLGIKSVFIEKDYWISRSLWLMTKGDTDNRTVFKGGTSLSKAYGLGARFSEDVDIAISEAWNLSGNQLKKLISRISKDMTAGLEELVIPGLTSKGSHYHKAFYLYPQAIEVPQVGAIKAGQLLVEINSFANPYPFERRLVSSFLTDFFRISDNERFIEEYDMQPFEVNVLDKKRTLTEKFVSLFRCSLADQYISQLSSKIRHFYDLYQLLQDKECRDYLKNNVFLDDFKSLWQHDRMYFDKPNGWQDRKIESSPLLTDFQGVWSALQETYMNELPELAYRPIPDPTMVKKNLQELIDVIRPMQSQI
ncbi:MAG: nucleotidyl transferase AbiEii/AbiGii toxin family protein [Lentimicrobiaceae bacterium]|nr:nucleotidyl transferase AbiEii/AbiGii toxin family protein [Lentimicrobiaceae bacterium]